MSDLLADIPSVDKVINDQDCTPLLEEFGRQPVVLAIRSVLNEVRAERKKSLAAKTQSTILSMDVIITRVQNTLELQSTFSLRPVFNLTGTILHTNLGRAALPEQAIARMTEIASGASNLEFDLVANKRGDRDTHVEDLITRLTGAEAATIVNNNAAAVLLTLNTLAFNREVPVSRGELVEIGGSFRIPEIMSRSGCQLVEVGATNRTHLSDYEQAINDNTAILLKVHTSNYEIRGFTHSVSEAGLSLLAAKTKLPLVTDLGSGTLINLEQFGLPHEPTAAEAIASGADIVTFSGDKLLGGPQAGIIIGKKTLIDQIKSNPLKRALRVDKITISALFEVLGLYLDPDRLQETLPTIRHLARSFEDVNQLVVDMLPAFQSALGSQTQVTAIDTLSQVGSGSLPLDQLPSKAIAISSTKEKGADSHLQKIAGILRQLPMPILGRLNDGQLIFDLRTLDAADALSEQLEEVNLS